jgi:hypothetical protein
VIVIIELLEIIIFGFGVVFVVLIVLVVVGLVELAVLD